jgi:hypothetical protein
MAFMKQAPKRYFLELTGAMALYLGVLWYSVVYVNAHPAPSLLKTLIALSPMAPVCLAAVAIIRFYNRMDEMLRRVTLENIALAAGFMAILSMGLGFGENAGLPHLGIIWAWPLMGIGWAVVAIWRGIPMAAADGRNPLWIGTKTVLVIALPTLAYTLIASRLGWPHNIGIIVLVATAALLAQQAYCLFIKRCGE